MLHNSDGLEGLLSHEMWDKMKGILRELTETLNKNT